MSEWLMVYVEEEDGIRDGFVFSGKKRDIRSNGGWNLNIFTFYLFFLFFFWCCIFVWCGVVYFFFGFFSY